MLKVVNTRKEFLHEIIYYLPKKPICAEIGVHEGFFSKNIYEILSPSKLYLIDPWEIGSDKNSPTSTYTGTLNGLQTAYSTNDNLNEVNKTFSSAISKGEIIIKRGFSYDVVDDFMDDYFDFIYIDATHIYESVKADLNMFFPKLKKTGLMCGHDYQHHNSFGVIKAVNEFIKEKIGDLFLLSEPAFTGGDFAIRFNKNQSKQRNTNHQIINIYSNDIEGGSISYNV